MCGIAGCVVEPGARPPIDALERMAEALAHRGPDGAVVEIIGSVGLAHTRLAVVDPGPSGAQPMHHPSGRWVLSYNGEIYNHAELRRSLDGPFNGHGDTETLLHALDAWGEAAIARCNGIFAFAAIDQVGRRLLLARDHLGIKPLYIARGDGILWFASEIKALLAAGIPRRPDPGRLAEIVALGFRGRSRTPIEAIERIPAGTIVEIDLETLARSERRWYEPAEEVDPELQSSLTGTPPADLTTRLIDTLGAAVERQLMGDVRIGAMCSGGLDSSLVTALARRVAPHIGAYNAAISDEVRDEHRWAEQLARTLGVEFRTIGMTLEQWRAELVPAVAQFEYPNAYMGMVPISTIARTARRDGVKVLLTGEGGDEVFGGYAFNHWKEASRFLPPTRRLRLLAAHLRSDGVSFPQRLRGHWRGRPVLRLLRANGATGDGMLGTYVRSRAERAYAHHPPRRRDLEAVMIADLFNRPLPGLLNREDKNAMAASVEARVPYLDREVLALALNLPVEQRIGPPPKRILRAAARRLLPASFARRPKYTSMQVDPRRFISARADPGFLQEGYLRDALGIEAEAWRGLVRGSLDRDLFRLWTGEIWCRLFIEGQDTKTVDAALWPSGP